MKIPTFAPLVLLNLFGYSTGSSDQQFYAPEPAVKNLPDCDSPQIQSNLDDSIYDFLVVGAGAGGGPLAARLASEGWSTLVIEAGKDHVNFNTTIPLYLIQATEDPEISLNYNVSHYPKGTKYGDVKTWYPRSQGLGGCTIHNALINLIPHKWDFEQLQNMFNDETWGWENMAKYYSRVENNLWLPSGLGLPIGHGYGGWLSTQLPPTSLLTDYPDQQLADLVHAIRTARPSVVNEDYNDWRNDEVEGGSWITLTKQANGTRSSVRDRLMEVHSQSPRLLKFAFESWATKVLTCKTRDNKIKAYGVEAFQGEYLNPVSSKFKGKGKGIERVRRWYAKKEVILSAGPFETPKLLMACDREQLEKYNIKPLVHSPGVGQNLQDRVEQTTVFTVKKPHLIFQNCTFGYDPAKDPCLAEWFANGRKNVYAASPALYASSYKSSPSLPYRDVWNFWGPAAFFGYYPGWGAKALQYPNAFTNIMLKAHTGSRGWVQLTGPDPQDKLDINKNEFVTEESLKDLEIVKDGMKITRDWVNKTELFNKHVDEVIWPSPKEVKTDEDYKDFIRKNQWGHHACCTAKMGKDGDETAVLDGQFRVRGVSNLRVVDLSIWPTIPGMFVVAPMYMVSERAADVIIDDIL
ncbi:GMC oxidoreductase [Tulasnella calospora MUT 4182]|uniref:GMC oxidoreductase n=1 Tax=Tulasnella calospora MUT 4182 TaxID=1051891 RepID=A0A0C3QIJ6_9AGAM|nr:GMC oxidoreductase [Tulasnella calospora MUT 4182]